MLKEINQSITSDGSTTSLDTAAPWHTMAHGPCHTMDVATTSSSCGASTIHRPQGTGAQDSPLLISPSPALVVSPTEDTMREHNERAGYRVQGPTEDTMRAHNERAGYRVQGPTEDTMRAHNERGAAVAAAAAAAAAAVASRGALADEPDAQQQLRQQATEGGLLMCQAASMHDDLA